MQTPNQNTTNDKCNESIASMLSLSGITVSLINLGIARTKVSNDNDDHVSTS